MKEKNFMVVVHFRNVGILKIYRDKVKIKARFQ